MLFYSHTPHSMTSPADHPDLADIGRRLQRRLDRVLETEQEAARVIARRSALLRDRLIDAEDAQVGVRIGLRTGHEAQGAVATVAVDHVELHGPRGATLIPFDQVAFVELS